MRQRLLLLEDPQDSPNYKTLGRTRRLSVQGGAHVQDAEAYDPCRGEEGRHVTVNGVIEPTIGINAGEQQFFRVVNASADRYFDVNVPGQQLGLVAQEDGYPIDTLPGNPHVLNVAHVLIPPAGRAEFVGHRTTGRYDVTIGVL